MSTSRKKARYRNKFNSEWSAEFPGIVKCNMSAEKARCIYCNTEFGIGHGGRSDVKRHVEREAHSSAVADAKKLAGNSIASKFACRRTKTAAVVREALAPDEIKKTVQYANEGPVTLMLDESNKRNNDKGCAILLRIVNPVSGLVQNRFLDMSICNKAAGANLFAAVDESMHEQLLRDVRAAASKRNNDLRVVREEAAAAAAANEVAVGSDDESDDDWRQNDENCTGLVTGTLSKFDLQREYKTDASEKFKSYIVDPQATTTKTDRYLKNRIKGWHGPAFYISTLPGESLDGPLNVSVSFTSDVTGPTPHEVPTFSVLRWCADDEEWIDASRTCDTNPGNLANKHEGNKFALSAKVCHGPDTCGDMAAVGLYAVAYVNTTFVNTPPVITSPTNVTVPEDTDFIVKLTAVDAEDDKLVFTLSNETTPHGTVSLSPDGKLTYKAYPDYNGHDVISYTVTEVRTDGETPLSADGQLLVILFPVNDPPVLQLFEYGTNIIPPSKVVYVDASVNSPDTNFTRIEFLLAAYDVDFFGFYPKLNIEFQDPQHGTISFPAPRMTSLMLPQDCSMPWVQRRASWDTLVAMITSAVDPLKIPNPCGTDLIQTPGIMWVTTLLSYTPHENYVGPDEIKVKAVDTKSAESHLTIKIRVNPLQETTTGPTIPQTTVAPCEDGPWNTLPSHLWPGQSPWRTWIPKDFVLQEIWTLRFTTCFQAKCDDKDGVVYNAFPFIPEQMCNFPDEPEIIIDRRRRRSIRRVETRRIDPSDCSKYYICLLKGNKISTSHHSCPPCQFFSIRSHTCVPVHTGPMCPCQEMCNFPDEPVIIIERRRRRSIRRVETRRIDPSDCSKYYVCLLEGNKISTSHHSCPPCQFFSIRSHTCVPVHTGPMCPCQDGPWNTLPSRLWPEQSPWRPWIPKDFVLPTLWTLRFTTCFQAKCDDKGGVVYNAFPFIPEQMCIFPDEPVEIDIERRRRRSTRRIEARHIDPSDCSKYYACLLCGNETLTRHYSCPPCHFFSVRSLTCVPVHTGRICQAVSPTPVPTGPPCEDGPWNTLPGYLWPKRSPWRAWIPENFALPATWRMPNTTCFQAKCDDTGGVINNAFKFVPKKMCPPGVVTLRVDPSDCAKFYICESATRARRLSCPVCQFFNEDLRTCVPVHRGPSCSGGLTEVPPLTCITFEHGWNHVQGLKGVWVKNHGVKIVKSGCVRKNCGYFSNGATLEIPFFKNNFAFRSFSVSFFFRSNKDGGGFIFNGCAASSRWSLSAGYRGRYVTTKMNDVNKQLDVGTNDGTWHHYALSWNGRQASVYIDKVLIERFTVKGPLRNSQCSFIIGKNSFASLDGYMDEICLYRRALSQGAVNKIHDLNKSTPVNQTVNDTTPFECPSTSVVTTPKPESPTVLTCITFNNGTQGTKGKKVVEHGGTGFERYCPYHFCRSFPECFFFNTDYHRPNASLVTNRCVFRPRRHYVPPTGPSLSIVQGDYGVNTTLTNEDNHTTTLHFPRPVDTHVRSYWSHYALSWDGQVARVYIDSQLLVQKAFTGRLRNTPCPMNVGHGVKGFMDEVCFLKGALSSEDVEKIDKTPYYIYQL
ncbi:hypothetical protein LSAT2_010280 [Lamellibrachia satsuma]|nr:hypothetical protein LSAT2_010280 [Lamellibrachia satsuma]